ncbi:hypothetical protein CBS101457_000036 [Exobasidium rhododendri]|nr:hypothetical protein CBS101457_000036 [Exobasidium rhododendri]
MLAIRACSPLVVLVWFLAVVMTVTAAPAPGNSSSSRSRGSRGTVALPDYQRHEREFQTRPEAYMERKEESLARSRAQKDLDGLIEEAKATLREAGKNRLASIAITRQMVEMGLKPEPKVMRINGPNWTRADSQRVSKRYVDLLTDNQKRIKEVAKIRSRLEKMSRELNRGGLDHEAQRADALKRLIEENQSRLETDPHTHVAHYSAIDFSSGSTVQDAIGLVQQDKELLKAMLWQINMMQAYYIASFVFTHYLNTFGNAFFCQTAVVRVAIVVSSSVVRASVLTGSNAHQVYLWPTRRLVLLLPAVLTSPVPAGNTLKDTIDKALGNKRDKGKAVAESSTNFEGRYQRYKEEYRSRSELAEEKKADSFARYLAKKQLSPLLEEGRALLAEAGEHKLLTIAYANQMLDVGMKPAALVIEGESAKWSVYEAKFYAKNYPKHLKEDEENVKKIDDIHRTLTKMSQDLRKGGLEQDALKADALLKTIDDVQQNLVNEPHSHVAHMDPYRLFPGKGHPYTDEAIKLATQDAAPIEAMLAALQAEQHQEASQNRLKKQKGKKRLLW